MLSCAHYEHALAGCDTAFSVDASHITFGAGCLAEAGDVARGLGISRIGLFTDDVLVSTPHVQTVRDSLTAANVDVALYDNVRVEPTDESFQAATKFAIDADFLAYVNAPIGEAEPIPGPLRPHIACPTTSGTGSECTGIAVFDLLAMKAKTGIAHKYLRPTRALIDPDCTTTLPANVVASSAFDVLSHALESYTARPYNQRPAPATPSARPSGQGANPWSDLGCAEALRIIGRYLVRGVVDPADVEARHQLMWAATLAGIAFGNAGCHLPHGMSYSVAGMVKDYQPDGYPMGEPIVPHGISVIVNSPAVFALTATQAPERHRDAAEWLGVETSDLGDGEVGDALAGELIRLMQSTDMPNGLEGIGYDAGDIKTLVDGSLPQRRLLDNAPLDVDRETLTNFFSQALRYW
jgi:alcohol dehydrogenase class IV